MKKIYLSLFAFALALPNTISAQTVKATKPLAKKSVQLSDKAEKSTIVYNKVSLWQDDFSTPSNWAMTNNSAPATDWTISTDANAAPVTAFKPLGFTSVGNGFAIVDSDAQGQGASQDATITYTGLIDLTGYANVSITFEQAHRRYQETTTLKVSGDGGATWTDYIINDGMAVNTNTTNPSLVQVNISSVAGNSSQVKIAFNYAGAWDWFWAIDDINIIETPDYDLKLTNVYWGSVGYWGARLPYTKVPSNQIQPVFFGGITENIGALNQSDIVFSASSGTFNGVSAAQAIAPGAFDTLETQTQLTLPATIGSNSVSFAVTSSATDADASNNTIPAQTIEVTDFVYARDMGTATGGSYNQGNGFEVGNVFDIFTTTQSNSVTFIPTQTAVAGAQVYARIYGSGFNFYSESDLYTLKSSDLGNPVSLVLQDVVDLIADSSYVVVVGSYGDGGATNDLVVSTSGISEAQTTFYFDQTDQTWYYTTATPMVRLNTTVVTGIKENENVSFLSVYPNPAKDNVAINFELKNETKVNIEITDLSGKTVYTQNAGSQQTGKNTVSINTTTFSNGIYLVNFVTDNGVVTEKLVINK